MKLNTLRIRTQLLGGFVLVLVIALAQSGLSLTRLGALQERSADIADTWLPSVKQLGDIGTELGASRAAMLKLLLVDNPGLVDGVETEMKQRLARLDQARAAYAADFSSAEEKALYEQFEAQFKATRDQFPNLFTMMRQMRTDEAREIGNGAATKAYAQAAATLNQLIEMNARGATAARQAAQSAYTQGRAVLLVSLLAMAATGLGIGWLLASRLTRAAQQAVRSAERIAAGDLSQPITATSGDEMGQLMESLAAMQQRLRGIVAGVRENAEHVATASAEIAQGNNDLSQRTEQQAGALQQTTSTMSQLAQAVQQTADSAQQANRLALEASGIAGSGGEAVNRVVETMRGIHDASRQIGDIIGVVDSIAFQTNILALNAAVEAARAGEQGRGFAVVASEVRSLAQRSAEAARQIKSLVGNSVDRVEQGTKLVDQAGETMQNVLASIRHVTDIVGAISTASSRQSGEVDQVGQAILRMDHSTQQNAALVEQSAAAAENLREQAARLVTGVSMFRLEDTVSASSSAAASR